MQIKLLQIILYPLSFPYAQWAYKYAATFGPSSGGWSRFPKMLV